MRIYCGISQCVGESLGRRREGMRGSHHRNRGACTNRQKERARATVISEPLRIQDAADSLASVSLDG